MKSLALFAVFLICVNVSFQLPKIVNCPSDFVPSESLMDSCGIYSCRGHNKMMNMGCAVYRCVKNSTGYNQQDNSKQFPECCGGPVCEN